MASSTKNISDDEWALLQDIGRMYKQIRLESGLTQRQAADSIGTSQARVPVLEQGQADVMVTTLMRWASVYGYVVEIQLVPNEQAQFNKALAEAMAEFKEEV